MVKTRRGGTMIDEITKGMPAPPSRPVHKESPVGPSVGPSVKPSVKPSVEPSVEPPVSEGPMYGPVKKPPPRPRRGGKTSRWLSYVKKTMKANKGKPLRVIMKIAKKTYKKRI